MSEHPKSTERPSLDSIKEMFPYLFEKPKVHDSVFIAKNAIVLGDVEIGEHSSVWYNVVIRGDMQAIKIGKRTNIQDNAVVHVTYPRSGTVIGDNVTVGHSALIHACTVGDGALIGMGAILLDGCKIGENALIAAGALVPPNVVVPPHSKFVGSPGKVVSNISEAELAWVQNNAEHYRLVAFAHRQMFGSQAALAGRV